MGNLKKIEKMSYLAFLNGMRLHRDSIVLFKNRSYPSAFAFSILAQEEFGKSYLLEEIIFQDTDNLGLNDEYANDIMKSILSHRVKQGWFSRQADDFFKYYKAKKFPKIVTEISNGQLDEQKQNALYVGITKTHNKKDLIRGRIINPNKCVRVDDARRHITRVNDFLIELIEMTRGRWGGMDSEKIDKYLTRKLMRTLEDQWPIKSRDMQVKLRKIRKLK